MSVTTEQLPGTLFLSFPEMKDLLVSELTNRLNYTLSHKIEYEDLLYLPDYTAEHDLTRLPYFCRTALLRPFKIKFDSIGEAAATLKKIQRNWAPYQFTCFRRASLLQEKLPYINLKPRAFPFEIPDSPIGMYTFLDEHTIIASQQTTSDLPSGTLVFEEDHTNPPSRAYLKIQESLTLAHHFFKAPFPHEGTNCFEAGACPGGWTWVLTKLGSHVVAVDRSELVPELMQNPLVEFKTHDAFTLTPQELGKFDWVFSDVICYPERLLEWINVWLESGNVHNMICTIKMQGEIDWNLIAKFAAIPSSRVVHLNYNKHELTWIHCE